MSIKTTVGNWQIYKNEKYGYSLRYPTEWYFLEDACCLPPPVYVVLNNYSTKQNEYASNQMKEDVYGVDITCLYEGRLDEIGEVQLLKKEGDLVSCLKLMVLKLFALKRKLFRVIFLKSQFLIMW